MAYHSNGGYSGDERESRSGDDRPDSDLGDKPTYVVEHLATFTVNKDSGITQAADGMRKLLQLEKTTGIWSQKMQLCLDRQWVLIIDYETSSIMERFSVTQINDPTAFTSQDPMEIYNNILVFIVNGGNSSSRSEMHIFQCQSISAVQLVEDLKRLRSGKMVIQHREIIPQPAPQTQSPGHVQLQQQQQQNQSRSNPIARDSFNYNQTETDSELGGLNDETSSTSSEKYERDVTVLNHCFDDIEKFIARLQHAAAASRELEKRRRNRKSKKKDPGEGLLSMRTRPPTEKEFNDIFAKFKLSFNLLAKLKAHIHDPNAPELVHFLFTPLALIVDASHDTYYEHLPARVIKPLMTREAINLLVNCVTSKETELWRSLGEPWTVPRDQWKGHVGSYHPVFFDGWSPDYPVIDELENQTTATNIKKRLDIQHFSNTTGADYNDYDGGPDKIYNPPGSPGLRDYSARSDISIDSIEHTGLNMEKNSMIMVANGVAASGSGGPIPAPVPSSQTDAWLEDLQARGAKIVQVTYPRTANNDKELTVVRGEYLEVLDDSRKWWKARNSRRQVAHVPHTIVTAYNYNDNDIFNNPVYTTQNYIKGNRQSAADVNDRYAITPERDQPAPASADWVRNKHLVTNNISDTSSDDEYNPNDYNHKIVTAATIAPPPPVLVTKTKIPLSNGKDENDKPPPPPPMPPMGMMTPTPVQSRTNTMNSRKSIPSQPEDMQEELKHVLSLFRERPRFDIHRTPEIFIQQSSSASEVENWLRAKGFSDNVVKKMNGLSGNELFALKRSTLTDYCGAEEGKRLASQITIQRNVSGYKTARSSELQAILAKAREKYEPTA